jgi:ABC-type proline/glycine betaine transport system permease subunit
MNVAILSVLGEHALISLVPWLVGVAVGGGLGYACALVARSLFSTRPHLRQVSTLLPWRTVVMTLPLVAFLIPVLIGLGTVAGGATVAFFVFLFAVPFTTGALLERWRPSPLAVRLVGGFRTLATASVAVATLTPIVAGTGGAGVLIIQGWRVLNYPQMLIGFSIAVLLAVVIDLLLGALQLLLSRISRQARPVPSATG